MALKGDAYPGLSRWALSVFMHILLRDGLRRPETHRGRRQCGDGGWDWSDVTTSQGGLAHPDHQQGALSHSVSGPSGGCGPGVPWFRLLLPDPWENKFLSLVSILWYFVSAATGIWYRETVVKVGRMKPGEVEGMVQTRRRAVVEKMEVLVGPGVRGEREIWAERWLCSRSIYISEREPCSLVLAVPAVLLVEDAPRCMGEGGGSESRFWLGAHAPCSNSG